MGVIAKDPIASKQSTTSAKILNRILCETQNSVRISSRISNHTIQSFNTTTSSQNQPNWKNFNHNNSGSNLHELSTNISKSKELSTNKSKSKNLDSENIEYRKHTEIKLNPNIQNPVEVSKTHWKSKSGLRFFRNPINANENNLLLKPINSKKINSIKSRSMDRPSKSIIN